ncbi:PorT family protein [Membranicola marinus]|uniref:PorT family protein n=1 Tax=Membranihabitans marinus TaxID=1227546 RepID=A0A953HXC3_9BACT|nr:porin family protein [Membranihabitans marinus]MBY5958351.1 PorT family protein [Membranihabitans marinus]
MRSKLLSAILCLLFTLPAFAQWQLSPIVGLNISKFRTSSNYSTEGFSYAYKNGLMGGLNIKYTPDNPLNIQLESTFSQKGTEHNIDDEPGRNIVDLNYIDLGVIIEYPLNEIIAVNAGGSYGINVGEKYNGKNNPAGKLHNGTDYGAIGGLKFYIGKLFIRTNYYHGLNPILEGIITDENGVPTGDAANEYNQMFQVSIGYYFL